ncbi:hypothetical protein JXR93_01665 [bacterium]|nr:hypothetical protein [bacterium]
MRFIIFLLILITLISCGENKNRHSKEKFLKQEEHNPYLPKLTPPSINENRLKEGDMIEFEKIFNLSYGYTTEAFGAHKSVTKSSITFERDKKLSNEIPNVKVDKDKGASDENMPPKINNSITLDQETIIEQESGENFKIVSKNSNGEGKEIRWINHNLFVKSIKESFVKRTSISDEHLKFRDEPIRMWRTLFKLLGYQAGVIYKGEGNYSGRECLIFDFTKRATPYKTIQDPHKRSLKEIADIQFLKGTIQLDKKTYIPLEITMQASYNFESFRFKGEIVKAKFSYSRKIDLTSSIATIEEPKENEIVNILRAPDEADAEEKILSFKEGHSQLEKLKKAEEERLNKIKPKENNSEN